ncbi:Protein CBG23838 [Caenorhabditis briggsae]|uniref:Protein CBG23838 n=1 Tax=Caenorhabditis briggsae TaxID=6238 RepID=A8WJE9_CAEBR|nr:Protein CBG23838 [Caenorhabditis briggsae]CAP20591.1 Protein CBG23838 [Caenorhabditis briggsae]
MYALPNESCRQQRGAVEACWAHNPEVGGSKPLAARTFFRFFQRVVSIHRPLGYGPSTLPLRHAATDVFDAS